jgi:IclR family KDG regulon transcriptional repressor
MAMELKQSGAARVMAVLELLGSADAGAFPQGMTVADISRALGREKSVISRQLRSLLESRLVTRGPDGHYGLSWQLFALSLRAGNQRLIKEAEPVMARLTELVRERTHLTVISDGQVLTVHSQSSQRSIEAVGWIGRTIPVNRSSSGMALMMDQPDEHILSVARRGDGSVSDREAQEFLRHVRDARQRGYAIADRIFDPELVGIGAPVRDLSGRITAAVNISGPASRIHPHLGAFAGHLVSSATILQQRLWS